MSDLLVRLAQALPFSLLTIGLLVVLIVLLLAILVVRRLRRQAEAREAAGENGADLPLMRYGYEDGKGSDGGARPNGSNGSNGYNGSNGAGTVTPPTGSQFTATYNGTNFVLGIPSTSPFNQWIFGGSGAWETATNWSLGHAPVSGEQVLIDIAGLLVTVTVSSGSQVATDLASQENVALTGGTLTLSGTSTIYGTLSVSGGTLAGTGDLALNGGLSWSGGTISGSGALTVGGAMGITGTSAKTLDGRTLTHTNAIGSSLFDSTGTMNLNGGAVFRNAAGAILNFNSASSMFLDYDSGATATFDNLGTVNKGGAGTLDASTFSGTSGLAFNNSGQINVTGGTLKSSSMRYSFPVGTVPQPGEPPKAPSYIGMLAASAPSKKGDDWSITDFKVTAPQ